MLKGSQPHEIIQATREDVVRFEDPLSWFLDPCSEAGVREASAIDDPSLFAAKVYNIVRRVEAAATKYAQEGEPRIRAAAQRAKALREPIGVKIEEVRKLVPSDILAREGKESLLDRFQWALWVLNVQLPAWGY